MQVRLAGWLAGAERMMPVSVLGLGTLVGGRGCEWLLGK